MRWRRRMTPGLNTAPTHIIINVQDIKLWTLILSLPIVTVAAWLPPRKADGVNIKHYNIGTIARTMAWAAHSPIILLMNMSGLDKSFLYILGLAAARSMWGNIILWMYVITFYLHGTKWINLFNIECTASCLFFKLSSHKTLAIYEWMN